MITVIKWATWILMWIMTVAFAWSDVMCMIAIIHYRKDRKFMLTICAFCLAFTVIAAAALYTALSIGRNL